MTEIFSIVDPFENSPLEVFETVPTTTGYTVRCYNEEKSAIITLTLNSDKRIHSFDDQPAYIWADIDTDKKLEYAWFENGLEHRTESYSYIRYNGNGSKGTIRWYQNGELHRNHREGFASETFCAVTGNLEHAAFAEHGAYYHPHEPAHLEFDAYSRIAIKQFWYTEPYLDKEHRTNGPSSIFRDPGTGMTIEKRFKQNGMFYRLNDEPPILRWDKNSHRYVGHYPDNNGEFNLPFPSFE